jgi:hypothetical protein
MVGDVTLYVICPLPLRAIFQIVIEFIGEFQAKMKWAIGFNIRPEEFFQLERNQQWEIY